jgi:hypothetical protein
MYFLRYSSSESAVFFLYVFFPSFFISPLFFVVSLSYAVLDRLGAVREEEVKEYIMLRSYFRNPEILRQALYSKR